MKKLKNFTVGCGIICLSLLTLPFNTNAQTTQKPDLNLVTPIVGGLVVKYQVNTDTRDTVWSRIEIAATAAFLNPQVFWRRMSDTINSYSDTLTEAKGLAPAPAGYFIRIWTVSLNRNDSVVSITDYGTTLESVKTPTLKITQSIPHESGCYFSMNIFSGNSVEKLTVPYKYSYDSINWFPAGTRTFVGKIVSTQDSLTGLFANKKVHLKIPYSNSVGSGDTVLSFVTTLVATKPILEITQIIQGTNQVEVKGNITTFNQKTSLNHSVGTDTFQSLKSEPFSFVVKNLTANTVVSGKIIANSVKGTTTLGWDSKTLPAPVEPKLTIGTIYIGSGKATLSWSWQTSSDNLLTRVDAKIYSDSNETTPVKVTQVSSGSANQSGSVLTDIELEKGTYWVRLTGELSKGGYPKSNLYKFQIKNGLGFEGIYSSKLPVQCKLYTVTGQLISESYEVTPSVNLFDAWLPKGMLIAVPTETSAPFKVFNQEY